MKRRQLLQASAGLLGSLAVGGQRAGAQTGGSLEFTPQSLQLTWLHHSCVLFEGEGKRFLVNPFRPAGCTAGYPAPSVAADLVLLSSRLLDEGALDVVPGNPRVLFQPGDYFIDGIRVQGVRMPRGPRFGLNVGWRWRMAGIDIVHLGGALQPIGREQSILLARPDLLLVPVGGWAEKLRSRRGQGGHRSAAAQVGHPDYVPHRRRRGVPVRAAASRSVFAPLSRRCRATCPQQPLAALGPGPAQPRDRHPVL